MRSIIIPTLAVLTIAVAALAADNTLGTWKYNTAKSKGAPGASPIKNLTVTREGSEGGVRVTAKGERADGSKIETVTDAKYDGKSVPVTGEGLTWDKESIKQVNANTLTHERSKEGGKYHTKVRTAVSADGKTLTATSKGTGADGKRITTKAVFDRQ
jgi:hypothetical protein